MNSLLKSHSTLALQQAEFFTNFQVFFEKFKLSIWVQKKKNGVHKAVQVGSSHVFVRSVRSYVVRLLYRLLFDTYLIKHISTRLIQQDDVRLYR